MATAQAILAKLYHLQRRGIAPGLERVRMILEQLGNPHRALRAIHIAGTNGKGTVSSVLASVLRVAGEEVGLYTSPHIRSFNERIRLNGNPISDDEIVSLYRTVEELADRVGASFFEVTTVMAFLKFSSSASISILECGLGGRLDATNVIQPAVAIITCIDEDHREWLGDTLEAIAAEKAGIIKEGVPVIVGEPRPALRWVFQEHAAAVGATSLVFLDDCQWHYRMFEHTLEGMVVDFTVGQWHFERLFIPLHGKHQLRNVAIALLALQEYWKYHCPSDAEEIVREGLQNLPLHTGLRARIEVVQKEPLVVFDVAHNPAGCAALVEVLKTQPFGGKWHIVFGVMRDKDYAQMLSSLAAIARRFYFAPLPSERACDTQVLYNLARQFGVESEIFMQVEDALEVAMMHGEPTLCVGSFFMIEEAFNVLDKFKEGIHNPMRKII